jgi:lysophospholipase
MLVKARQVDVIVASEGSANTHPTNWPNGKSLIFTRDRLKSIIKDSHQLLPPIPETVDDFVATGTNLRPTFFGCNPTHNPPEWPLVIYIPNAPPLSGADPVTK